MLCLVDNSIVTSINNSPCCNEQSLLVFADALMEGLQLVSKSWGETLSDKTGILHADALTQLGSALGLLLQQHAAPDISR